MWHWVVNPTVSEVGTHIRSRMGRAAETARMIIASQEESEYCYGSAIAVSTLMQQFQIALTGNGPLMTPDEAEDFKWMESTNPEYFLHLLSLTMYGQDNYSLRVLKHVRSGEPMLIGKTAGNSMRSTPIGAGGLMSHREITMANAKKAKKGEIPGICYVPIRQENIPQAFEQGIKPQIATGVILAHTSPSHGMFPVFSTLKSAANLNPTMNSWIAFDTSQHRSITGICPEILAKAYIAIPTGIPPECIVWATNHKGIVEYVHPLHTMGSQLQVIHDKHCKDKLDAICPVPSNLTSPWLAEERERQEQASNDWYNTLPDKFVIQQEFAECIHSWTSDVWNCLLRTDEKKCKQNPPTPSWKDAVPWNSAVERATCRHHGTSRRMVLVRNAQSTCQTNNRVDAEIETSSPGTHTGHVKRARLSNGLTAYSIVDPRSNH